MRIKHLKFSFITIVLLLALLSCTASLNQPTSVTTSHIAIVKSLKKQAIDAPIGSLETATSCGVSLSFDGIYALNQSIAFLYGQTEVGSTILRTEDQGQHWQEVFRNGPGHSVRYVVFTTNDLGWALEEYYQGEANGPIALYRTEDSGRNWIKSSIVPTQGTYWELVNVQFSDPQTGQIDLYEYETGNQVSILKTIDGGRSWQPRERLQNADADVYRQAHNLQKNPSIGKDGSEWEIEAGVKQSEIRINQKRSPGLLVPVTRIPLTAIPKRWGYQDGQLVPLSKKTAQSCNYP
jgi:photosystem II stability/assembly factor-like uncharacterized protein